MAPNNIGAKIKTTRRARGLTQEQLAEAAQLSRSYLADVEGNRYNPSLKSLKKIAKALNVNVALFMNDNSEVNEILYGIDEKLDRRDMLKETKAKYDVIKASTINVPIVGTVAAGSPILADENIESYMPFPVMLLKGNDDFLLYVKGDSMQDVDIHDGDMVLVHPQPTAENGQTVIARINGEVTCKRFYKTDNKCILEPANPKYKPIDCNEIEIVGIVCKVIKSFF